MKKFLLVLLTVLAACSNIEEEETVLQAANELRANWEEVVKIPEAAIVWLKKKGLYQPFIDSFNSTKTGKDSVIDWCTDKLNDREFCQEIDVFLYEYINPIDEKMKSLTNIFWISPLKAFDVQEKEKYCEILNYEINYYDDVAIAIDAIKQLIKFTDTYIIIDGNLYADFILLFIKNIKDIMVIPKLILFTKNKEQFLR